MLGKGMLVGASTSGPTLTIKFCTASGMGSVFRLMIYRPSGEWISVNQDDGTTMVIPMSEIGEDIRVPASIRTFGEGPIQAILANTIGISNTVAQREIMYYKINDRSKDAYGEFTLSGGI